MAKHLDKLKAWRTRARNAAEERGRVVVQVIVYKEKQYSSYKHTSRDLDDGRADCDLLL
jgi:hypothetical protein